jgi:hypothetical protein
VAFLWFDDKSYANCSLELSKGLTIILTGIDVFGVVEKQKALPGRVTLFANLDFSTCPFAVKLSLRQTVINN